MTANTINNTISVDCVIFGYDNGMLNVLLVERMLKEPQDGQVVFADLTLAGNHIYEHETLDEAAQRILFDLTGLKSIYLEQFKSFAHPDRLKRPNDQLWLRSQGRNPDQRIITVGYYSLLASHDITLEWKGRNVKWQAIADVTDLAFDHMEIFQEALKALRQKLIHEPIGFELLPAKFTLTQLQQVYETILGTTLDKRNFRKKVAKMKYLVPLDEKQKGVAHKPAQLYTFNRDIYEQTKKELFDFNI